MKYLINIGINSKKAFEKLKKVEHKRINKVLELYSKNILKNKLQIIKQNLKDIKNVKRNYLIDRLMLNDDRIDDIRHSINEIIKFKNPVGNIIARWKRSNKLNFTKVSTPNGVIGVIYESRPNVTADVASLCLKSGNG